MCRASEASVLRNVRSVADGNERVVDNHESGLTTPWMAKSVSKSAFPTNFFEIFWKPIRAVFPARSCRTHRLAVRVLSGANSRHQRGGGEPFRLLRDCRRIRPNPFFARVWEICIVRSSDCSRERHRSSAKFDVGVAASHYR